MTNITTQTLQHINYDDVAAAANALTAESNRVTNRAVREALGRGSASTIHKHLQTWKAKQPVTAPAPALTLPQSIIDAIVSEITKAQAQTRTELHYDMSELRATIDEIANDNESLEAALAAERDTARSTAAELDTLKAELEKQLDELNRTKDDLELATAKTQDLYLELATATVLAQSKTEEAQTLKKELTDATNERNAANTREAGLIAKLESANQSVKDEKERSAELKNSLIDANNRNTALSNDLKDLSSKLSTEKSDKTRIESELKSANIDKSNLSKKLDAELELTRTLQNEIHLTKIENVKLKTAKEAELKTAKSAAEQQKA